MKTSYRKFFSEICGKFNSYVNYKYVLDNYSFKRKGKFSLSTAIKYPLLSNKKTTSMECNKIIQEELGDDTKTITKQGVSDRMKHISPQVYKDMNDDGIKDLYDNAEDLPTFKGLYLNAIDASIIEIPNVEITRKEMGIPENTPFRKYTSTARISCMTDALNEFIISSNITYKDTSEI